MVPSLINNAGRTRGGEAIQPMQRRQQYLAPQNDVARVSASMDHESLLASAAGMRGHLEA
jgi:hypothetical protein